MIQITKSLKKWKRNVFIRWNLRVYTSRIRILNRSVSRTYCWMDFCRFVWAVYCVYVAAFILSTQHSHTVVYVINVYNFARRLPFVCTMEHISNSVISILFVKTVWVLLWAWTDVYSNRPQNLNRNLSFSNLRFSSVHRRIKSSIEWTIL